MFSPYVSGHCSHIKGPFRAQQSVSNICDSWDPGWSQTDFFLWCHYLWLASVLSTLWHKYVRHKSMTDTYTHTHIYSLSPLTPPTCDYISPFRMNLITAVDTLMPHWHVTVTLSCQSNDGIFLVKGIILQLISGSAVTDTGHLNVSIFIS